MCPTLCSAATTWVMGMGPTLTVLGKMDYQERFKCGLLIGRKMTSVQVQYAVISAKKLIKLSQSSVAGTNLKKYW